jgi:hypothetical protein
MQFSNDNTTYSTPEAYGTTKSWTLLSGDGDKTVYAKFKDYAGNWSTPYSDTIALNTDPYTKSLLHMNGTDGSTTFTDSAPGGTHTWTVSGNAQIDTAQSKFGGASGLFDGTGDGITTPASSDFNFGSGDFTIDLWIYLNKAPSVGYLMDVCENGSYFISPYGGFEFGVRDNGAGVAGLYFCFYASTGGVGKGVFWLPTGGISTGTWHHSAVIRSGNTLYFALDGTLSAGDSFTYTQYDNNNTLTVGKKINTSREDFNGWIDELRISKGIARWTSNFTPPTSEY